MLLVRKLYLQDQLRFTEQAWETAGSYAVRLPQGAYEVKLCGGGGAGGANGVTYTADGRTGVGGAGGAGAPGSRITETFTLSVPTTITLTVGAGGLHEGGNGGVGGSPGRYTGGAGGRGGGGGMPSYIQFNPQTVITNYYGWKCSPVDSGTYVGPTKTFYVTFASDNLGNIYISDTPMEYVSGNFVLMSGNTYTDGQQLFYLSDSATISITIQISNGTVQLVGTTRNTFGATVVPLDISNSFVGNVVLTTSLTPETNSPVYNTDFTNIGNVASVDSNGFVYDGQTYSPYSAADTSTAQVVSTETIVANGGGGGGGGGGGNTGGRYSTGAGGGGGGGVYIMNSDGSTTEYAGKAGASAGYDIFSNGVNGTNGYGPSAYVAGGGGGGYKGAASVGGSGLGASGGSGGAGKDNDSDGWRRPGGAGGGGCGGTTTAGGGGGGLAPGDAYNSPGGNATNAYTTPKESYNYKGEASSLGKGGAAGQAGNNGWVYIRRIS